MLPLYYMHAAAYKRLPSLRETLPLGAHDASVQTLVAVSWKALHKIDIASIASGIAIDWHSLAECSNPLTQ